MNLQWFAALSVASRLPSTVDWKEKHRETNSIIKNMYTISIGIYMPCSFFWHLFAFSSCFRSVLASCGLLLLLLLVFWPLFSGLLWPSPVIFNWTNLSIYIGVVVHLVALGPLGLIASSGNASKLQASVVGNKGNYVVDHSRKIV